MELEELAEPARELDALPPAHDPADPAPVWVDAYEF